MMLKKVTCLRQSHAHHHQLYLFNPFYSFTVDIWTETMNTNSFLGITLHYITDTEFGLSLKKRILGVVELEERYTGEYISEVLKQVLDRNIKIEKVVCVITDGGSNIISACSTLFPDKHFHCFAHVINLIISKVFDTNPNAKNKEPQPLHKAVTTVKQIVHFFGSSVRASDELKKHTNLRLIQSVKTRWNSEFDMLKRYLDVCDEVNKVLIKISGASDLLRADEHLILSDVLPILNIFKHITADASADKEVTISKVIPYVDFLFTKMEQMCVDTDVGNNLKFFIINEMKKRLLSAEQNIIPCVATLLDQRYKKTHFKNPINVAKGVEQINRLLPNLVDRLRNEIKLFKNIPWKILWKYPAIFKHLTCSPLTNPLEFWSKNRHCYPKLTEQKGFFVCR